MEAYLQWAVLRTITPKVQSGSLNIMDPVTNSAVANWLATMHQVLLFHKVRRHPYVISDGHAIRSYRSVVWPSGSSVRLSSGGRILVFGGPFDNGQIGATWIFVYDGSTYQQVGSKLVGNDVSGVESWQRKRGVPPLYVSY